MLYPQQNLCRNKIDLSGIWDFQTDPGELGVQEAWYNGLKNARPIAVPGSWNEQYEDLYNYLSLAWYVKSVFIPLSWQGQRIFLRVGSACYLSTAFINGHEIGCHEGGHLPFAFDITDHVKWDSANVIAISIENELRAERVPSGNITTPLLPVSSYPKTTYDFFPFAGIHRPVVLYTVPQIYFDDITVVTEIANNVGILKIKVRLNAAIETHGTARIEEDDFLVNTPLVFKAGVAEALIKIPNAKFWSDRKPYLYHVVFQMAQDHYILPVGIRTIEIENHRLMLNGQPVKLKGFGRHEDFIASGKGLNLPLLIKDYQLMRWLGANSYRTAHYPYSEEEMQLADREGFLIINEIPATSLQFEDDENIALRLTTCLQQLDELIARDKNHPSVIMWSVANEPMTPNLTQDEDNAAVKKGKRFLDTLLNRARELDPTRPVTFVNLGGTPSSWLEQCDIICPNRYWGWYVLGGKLEIALASFEQELDEIWQTWGKPIIITEFGADAMAGMHGHPDLMWTEEYQAKLIQGYLKIAAQKEFIVGMHVWNFADFAAVQSVMRVGGLNMKGVFTRIRTPKAAAHVIREYWLANQSSKPDHC